MPALRFNVEKLRTTAWFKKSEAQIRKSLIAPSPIADVILSGTSPIGVTSSAIAYQTITLAQVIHTRY